MNRKIVFGAFSVILILGLVSMASAQLTVGVKAGNWIQYKVTFTGTPPDPSHDVVAANMTVLSVSGTSIYVNIVSTMSNGTILSSNSTLNLQTGQLIDNFIIPANLAKGDQFYDATISGNITIADVSQGTYAGATRTVINATSGSNTYVWDQATGIDVEGFSTGTGYTMHTLANATNIWQSIPEFNTTTIIGSAAVVGLVAVVTASVVLIRKRK
jgi:hypothetical protein